ncbi:MAG: ferredoxin--NADP reductase [Myxococcota bacterium]|nr:ferredoxin--NADP reductase [Myxococcota bacterium]
MGAVSQESATAESVGAKGPYHALRVAEVIDETADARSFALEIPDEAEDLFAYRAGQFLTFRVNVGGERLVRCYSLASSPDTDRIHKVTVKRIDDGRVSHWMNDNVSVGDTLETMRPAGVFVLQERTTPIVLFGGGSGVTPVISILKSALATTERGLKLVYANRDADSIIFRAELDELVAKYAGRLEVIHRLDVESGFVDQDAVRGYIGDALESDFYVCGPGAFMDTVEATFDALAIDRSQIFIERFISLSEGEAPSAAGGDVLEPGDAASGTISIQLDGEQKTVPYAAGQTLLEAARAGGLEPPFACEEGYCSCCMAKVVKGSVRMLANDALDDAQVEEGWVLTCQSIPTDDDLEVEYPD